MKRIHRIVILPDYQGIGIGNVFLNEIAKIYKEQKQRITIVTSTPVLINSLQKSKNWIMSRKPSRTNSQVITKTKRGLSDRLTASFEFIGDNNGKTY